MNKATKSAVKHYLNGVKNALPCSLSAKFAFVSMLKSQIKDFLEEFPEAGIEDIVARFGTAEAIASGFDVNDYAFEIKKYKNKSALLFLLSLVLLIGCVFLTVLLIKSMESGYIILTNDFDKYSQNQ